MLCFVHIHVHRKAILPIKAEIVNSTTDISESEKDDSESIELYARRMNELKDSLL